MALTDIVFDQANSHAADRGNVGVVQDNLAAAGMEVFLKQGVMQRWDNTAMQWEVFPLKYYTDDGWV